MPERATADERISKLAEVAEQPIFDLLSPIVNGLVNCLSPSEICDAGRTFGSSNAVLRRALVRRLERDIQQNGFADCHCELASDLKAKYETCEPRQRSGCGYLLEILAGGAPAVVRGSILSFCLASRHLAMRRRAYKLLRRQWLDAVSADVISAWERYADPDCADVVARYFPVSSLLERLDSLEEGLPLERLGALYLRVGADHPELLARLRAIDEITWAYVLVRLDRPLAEAEARDVVGRNTGDTRFGLLLWCIGKMGHWDLLLEVADRAKEILRERADRVLRGI